MKFKVVNMLPTWRRRMEYYSVHFQITAYVLNNDLRYMKFIYVHCCEETNIRDPRSLVARVSYIRRLRVDCYAIARWTTLLARSYFWAFLKSLTSFGGIIFFFFFCKIHCHLSYLSFWKICYSWKFSQHFSFCNID